jgi:hypothetical protein
MRFRLFKARVESIYAIKMALCNLLQLIAFVSGETILLQQCLIIEDNLKENRRLSYLLYHIDERKRFLLKLLAMFSKPIS